MGSPLLGLVLADLGFHDNIISARKVPENAK
jgi:hypothetical protein